MLYRLLTMYYMEGANQADIARVMGLSTAKVNRLLKQAKDQGMVEISIRMPSQHLFDLEAQLKTLSSLQEALIVPRMSDNADTILQTVGRAAADYLLQVLNDGDTICVSGGKTMNAIVQQLETTRRYDVRVVPATGARQGHYYTDVNNLAAQLAQKLGGTAYQMHAPVLVDSPSERDALLALRQINDVLDIARSAQIALFSVGSVIPKVSSYFDLMTQTVAAADWEDLLLQSGASGEVLAYLYDRDGRLCLPDFNNRVIGLSLDELRAIPTTIAVAATPEKALPIYGALRGNTIQRLVTDESTARAVLALCAEEHSD
jgi:DNA-binding transcriptional regulator LsrR (DeoR family)